MSASESDWVLPDWPAPANVRSIITTRNGGVSDGPFASLNLGRHVGDTHEAVAENRRRLCAVLPHEPLWLNQVHGTSVVRLDAGTDAQAIHTADAAVTNLTGRPCAVMVADCLPVLFCDEAGATVGAAHAGWRGLASGVLEATIASMHVHPTRLLAYLGPAIGPGAFEVGGDVRDAFAVFDPASSAAFIPIAGRTEKYLADFFTLARQRLSHAGLERIYGGTDCTVASPQRFYSYRRDGKTGRMAAVIWRE